ncbi:microcin C ABC transporter permease YejB [Paracoccus aerodenitrificans]|uniref:microcin C ABC transporter permease YejB n=1 Tax=Paracoccus aerodenitrificans TaxID=3017781 RepID=UPI0022F082C8|nr:microcin C ABC transporter permease YejB [Paracoccus aerodenitrificans]WBU65224.1 microcin C ABC transporter permease YejB [Paracoccus aerodenitrificans]
MAAYILRRLLLVIPTLLGILLVNFALIQFVPGGPIQQVIAQVQGEGDTAASAGSGQSGASVEYAGAQGLPQEFLDELELQMGFAEIVCEPGYEGEPSLGADECSKEKIGAARRFLIMLGNYATFDFGDSWFRSQSVVDEIIRTLPVSITLGLWSTLLAYLISIPLGIRKAVRDGTAFDSWTSGVIIVAYAIPAFLFAVLLITLFAGGSYWRIFPLRGLTSDNFETLSMFGKVKDYLWHIALPVISMSISGFATLTLLTKNSFLDEINKQYVMTARAKGLTERRVLYGHVFRNAMLIVIAGFPAMLLGILFGSSILIEYIFSLDGLGRLGFEAAVQRDYPLVFGTLYIFGLMALVIGIVSDLMYVLVDPRIDFEKRAG